MAIRHNLDGTKSERRGQRAFKHLADGSILEVNPTTGNVIAVERTAKSPEAEALVAHHGTILNVNHFSHGERS